MWLFTNQGFYSVVQHENEPDKLIVRCRVAADIESLRRQIPTLERFQDETADYRHRAIVTKAEWVAAAALLASEIDYPNFKDEVAERQGRERASVYGRVWQVLHPLQRNR